MALPTTLQLFLAFARVGTFAWGGGPSMIPLIQEEAVDRHHWMTDEQFMDALAAGYALPGPIATKLALWIGYEAGGPLGAAAACLGVLLPSALMLALVYVVWQAIKEDPRVEGLMRGVRPAVLALLAVMVIRLAPKSVGGWREGLVLVVAAGVLLGTDLHPAWVILASAGIGLVFFGGT